MSTSPEFRVGREIEVESSDGKFTPAKVIGPSPNNDEIMVQYSSTDSAGAKRREAVKKSLLRPKQPLEIGRKFRYGERVDAFVDGCWCEGVISEVSGDEKRFQVFLRREKEMRKFYAPDIRVHRDWTGGSWIPPLPKESPPCRDEIPAAFVKNAWEEKPNSVNSQEDILSNLEKTPDTLLENVIKQEKPILVSLQENILPNQEKITAASVKDARREETPDSVDSLQEDVLPNHKITAASVKGARREETPDSVDSLQEDVLPNQDKITAASVKDTGREETPDSVDSLQEDVLPNRDKITAASVKDTRREETPDSVASLQEDVLPNQDKIRVPNLSLRKAREKKEFSKGELVEIKFDEDGLRGAWFTASIIDAVGNDRFLVEYEDLRNDEDTGNLKEEVDAKDMRPYPPECIQVERYSLGEEVDAWYNDGWWEGKICKVLYDERYRVFFEETDEEIVFDHDNLRPRQDWIDNAWVTPFQASKRPRVG